MDEATDKRFSSLEKEAREGNQTLHGLELKIQEVKLLLEGNHQEHTAMERRMDNRAQVLETTIFGNGGGNLGMKTRVDRLEQTEETRTWSLRALWLGMIGVISRVIYDLIGKG